MLQLARWVGRRVTCTLTGHRMTNARIHKHGSIMPGYQCQRCGKEQALLYRWQEVRN